MDAHQDIHDGSFECQQQVKDLSSYGQALFQLYSTSGENGRIDKGHATAKQLKGSGHSNCIPPLVRAGG